MGSAPVSGGRGVRLLRALALTTALLGFSGAVAAHVQDFMARVVHLAPRDGMLRAYVQLPLALALLPPDWQAGGNQAPPPFLRRDADGRLAVDVPALHRDPDGLRARLREVLRLDGHLGRFEGARIDTLAERDPFSYLPAVEQFVLPGLALGEATELDLADAVVSLRLRFDAPAADAVPVLAGGAREWPELASRAVNIVRRHHEDGRVDSFQSLGALHLLLGTPDVATPAQAAAAPDGFVGYLVSGFEHVLIGLDHVLFILVLLLGARGVTHFLRSSLAFTAGHSITLCVGALGGLSELAWFAPAVEIAIAASIIYAGARILIDGERPMLAPAVFCVGLVHGFGFSFALQAVAPSLSGSFLSVVLGFNLGIELGQLALSLVAAPILWAVQRAWRHPQLRYQHALAWPCIAVASVWLVERSEVLLAVFP
ncbi:HupE/UreJ family protein [Denitromonas halophila]|uniref:HupE/UreJ family protein n=1 Tax=Denitromonas halophila TaxID=1629404 RepID=UPI0016432501|nr:HupE/UreJ family protein [Denitromonas halophila]